MQHHGSKYFARRAPLTPIPWLLDQKVKIQPFKHMVRLHIKLNQECRNVVAKILPPDPSNHKQTLGVGSNVKINFFKRGHVAYQIKWNHECSHMVANISPADPPPSPALGVKRLKYKFFRTWPCCIQRESQMQQHGSKCRERYNKKEIYQSWLLIEGLCTQGAGTHALKLKSHLISFISIAVLPACKISAKILTKCLSFCKM